MVKALKHSVTAKKGTSSEEVPSKRVTKRASTRKRIKARYDTHMPNKKHHRILIWVVFLACSTVIAGQLLYPVDRALPLAEIAHQRVGWQTHEQMAKKLDAHFRETQLKLVVDDDMQAELPLSRAGSELNSERMIAQLVEYPFWQRFIPFSILVQRVNLAEADVYYTESVLKNVSQEQAKKLSFPAVNAGLAIKEGQLVATQDKEGSEVAAKAVYDTIAHARPKLGGVTELTIPAKRVAPAQTMQSLQAVRSAAEAALARQVRVAADTHAFTPDNATVASWLQIATDEAGHPTLKVADEPINEFFDHVDATAGVPAGRTNINLTNGRETSRTTGATGKAINRDELRTQLSNWLLSGQGNGQFTASFREIAPSVMYDNKYTATEEGLRAYVTDAAARMNVRIAIQQIDGGRWTASARAGESLPSASTYKLFVAKWLFDEMDKGAISWSDPILDTTVSTCFDRMTIASTNPCAEAWLARVGRQNFNEYVYGLGFSRGTNFNMPVATHTTAHDLQRMMLGIHDGTIIQGANKERLLRSLSMHPFRYGIPTGSRGQVWDKVGFLWDYVHDTAIVKHPQGTYVMTIMTKGQSYGTIAALTREIERIMYP